jgi:hypothetical protein
MATTMTFPLTTIDESIDEIDNHNGNNDDNESIHHRLHQSIDNEPCEQSSYFNGKNNCLQYITFDC